MQEPLDRRVKVVGGVVVAAADLGQTVAAAEAGTAAAAVDEVQILAVVVVGIVVVAVEAQLHSPCQAPPGWKWPAPLGQG